LELLQTRRLRLALLLLLLQADSLGLAEWVRLGARVVERLVLNLLSLRLEASVSSLSSLAETRTVSFR
jgi:hypothetical protein